jgi:hypothetical protein
MKYNNNIILLLLALIMMMTAVQAQQKNNAVQASIHIDINNGHRLEQGSSGFNVRIADKVWNYTHPDFRQAVHNLQPGWLRYFSGTMGDAFSAATGQYNLDYALMMDKQEQYLKGHMFTEVKGPHRIIDLYHLLGEVGGKLVVTINAFTETPEMTAELARFCKNNHIEVEAWQFCNEPYFYVPKRNRYWWNDGYDYAAKMRPHADAIRDIFPEAKLALNFTWDGIWDFMKEIYQYQQENGRYWNVFSKHSYAPHIGGSETFEQAYQRANTKVVQVTGKEAMSEIEDFSWKGAPLLITEFGVWNKPLNGIASAIYLSEYTLRQLQHPNAFLIGSHEISGKNKPAKNMNHLIARAFNEGNTINTDAIQTGVEATDDGKALSIIHEATNNTTFTWETYVQNAATVQGMRNTDVEGVYARAFKGNNAFDYLAITNRSGEYHDFTVEFGGEILEKTFFRKYIWSEKAENKDIPITEDTVAGNNIMVPPYSIMLVKWKSEEDPEPAATRIYKADITEKGIMLNWWKRKNATEYIIQYGENEDRLNERIITKGGDNNYFEIEGLEKGNIYYFQVVAKNKNGKSESSGTISLRYATPDSPVIFKASGKDTTVTVFWRSVANATGYKVKVISEDGSYDREFDAKNVFGYRVKDLEYDKPYNIQVIAYNGMGEGEPSVSKKISCKKNLPITPRNISAMQTADDHIYLEWVVQDSISKNVRYRIYRGSKPHQFSVLAENIEGNIFIDTDPKEKEVYYTVKAYTDEGEGDFYPNIATVIKRDKDNSLVIQNVHRDEDHFLVEVSYDNIKKDKNADMGLMISDISYLNVEEEIIPAFNIKENDFYVKIPLSSLRSGRTYAIKAFIKGKGKSISTLPPYQKIKL